MVERDIEEVLIRDVIKLLVPLLTEGTIRQCILWALRRTHFFVNSQKKPSSNAGETYGADYCL